jgi:hypothetical protein
VSVAPEANLVAKDSKSADPASANRSFTDNTTLLATPVVDGRLLDYEPPVWDLDLECGVVEIAGWTPGRSRRQRLVDATVEPDEVAAGPEG